MMSIKDDAKAEQSYNYAWAPMEKAFGPTTKERTRNLERFLRHYPTMIKSAAIKEDEVYAEIRERVKNANENEIVEELQAISKYSKYYQRLLFPNLVNEPR